MTRIFLIRHGEAEGNLFRRIHGIYDSALTQQGLRQLAPLRARFDGVKLDAVYSSNLRRAMETAKALYLPRNLPLQVRPALREQNMGAWEDHCWGWAARYQPEQYDALNRDPARFSVPGCENYDAVLGRFLPALEEIARAHEGGTVAVFSHGSAIRMVLSHLLGYGSAEISRIPHCDNTAVAELTWDGGALHLLHYNDSSHLPPELSAFSRESWWQSEDFKDGRDLYYLPMDVQSDVGAGTYLRRYRDAWIASHGTDEGFSELCLLRARANSFADPHTLVEVFNEGVPCGMMELSPDRGASEGAGHISLLFLERDFRGQGLGVQLLGQAISYYRARERRFLRLCVAETNAYARRFYDRWGFREESREPGTLCPILTLRRDLSAPMGDGHD